MARSLCSLGLVALLAACAVDDLPQRAPDAGVTDSAVVTVDGLLVDSRKPDAAQADSGPATDAAADAGAADLATNRSCSDPSVCRMNDFCSTKRSGCPTVALPGICLPRPTSCPPAKLGENVCGCDNVDYVSTCAANGVGMSVAHLGACKTVPKKEEPVPTPGT
ncbi:MAG: hypothetical protein H6707_01400 [Deltaproteobacteria bacterium]|nr:hypothetical protein [Deltaproteobacteria bacterium]